MVVFTLAVGETYQTEEVLGVYSTWQKAMDAGKEYSEAWEEGRMLDQHLFIVSSDLDGTPGTWRTLQKV